MAITLKDLPEYGGKIRTKPQVLINDDSGIGAINEIGGIKLIVDDNIPESKKWIFPYDKYIEYGPEDEWWAIPWEFGHWKTKPVAYQIRLNGENVVICNNEFKDLVRGQYE